MKIYCEAVNGIEQMTRKGSNLEIDISVSQSQEKMILEELAESQGVEWILSELEVTEKIDKIREALEEAISSIRSENNNEANEYQKVLDENKI
jgi:hypothetical protein